MHQALDDGGRDNSHVQRERPVAEVIQVMLYTSLHFLDPVGFTTKAVDLRPTGNAGFDPVALDVSRHHFLIKVVVFKRMWARPDDRHISAQDVKKLRQLVQTGAPQERTDAGDPRVVARRLTDTTGLLDMYTHRAKLVDGEDAAIGAFALLLEDHRSTRRQLDRDGDRQQQR